MRRAAGLLRPERVTLGIAALAGLITLWNATSYPIGAGYDASAHTDYADFLINHLQLPVRGNSWEYYSPPLYYGLAGSVSWLGRHAGLGDPHKLGQLLNVPMVVGAVLLVALLARLLWPNRRWLPPAAAAYVCLSPVLMRTASMFHPEATDLFASVLCAYLAARIVVARRFGTGAALALGLALGAAQMVRQFELYTLAVVGLAWLAAVWKRADERSSLIRSGVIALAACVVVAGPWYGYRVADYGNAVFDRPHPSKPLFERQPARFYVSLAPTEVFTEPYRPHAQNRAWPETYSDVWGDWYGVFNWSYEKQSRPSASHADWLVAQNVIGIVPTAIALVAWLFLLATGLLRRSSRLLLVALMPLAALAGYFYFAIAYPTSDGDILKPTFMLSALWAWALCFAWGASHLSRRLVVPLVVLALADLPFLVYSGSGGLF